MLHRMHESLPGAASAWARCPAAACVLCTCSQPHAAACLGCCAAGWFWLQQQRLPLVIYGSAAHVWQREVALPAVGERSSITRGNKCGASLGCRARDLLRCSAALGCFASCSSTCRLLQGHQQDSGLLGLLPLEGVCDVTARKKGVRTEKRRDTDPGCGLRL